jgi:carbamoyl-phosphate synthase small subunit
MREGAPARLALEDGTTFAGSGFGAPATVVGEICFNTAMTGYQEVLTDPSYHGQIVAMTAAHVGNTGVNRADEQSRRPWVAGFVVRDASRIASSWRSEGSLGPYLEGHGITAAADIDTRRLTRHVRSRGAMLAALSTVADDLDDLVDIARAAPTYEGRDLVREVSTTSAYTWGEGRARAGGAGPPAAPSGRWRVAAFDFGIKHKILDLLTVAGCSVTVLPATTGADEVLEAGYDGVFLSNGPGDPEPLDYAVATTRRLLGRVPVFGICLGQQVLARALGARTFKLPFGHRGGNHPVKRLTDSAVEITCQNHGFAVDPVSLAGTGARVTHVNLNDGTIEGLEVEDAAFAVQYHPEAAPGPHDSRYLFDRFLTAMERFGSDAPRPAVSA